MRRFLPFALTALVIAVGCGGGASEADYGEALTALHVERADAIAEAERLQATRLQAADSYAAAFQARRDGFAARSEASRALANGLARLEVPSMAEEEHREYLRVVSNVAEYWEGIVLNADDTPDEARDRFARFFSIPDLVELQEAIDEALSRLLNSLPGNQRDRNIQFEV